jgi:DNA (cytosine-5)-methyltransferase 1
MYRGVFMRRKDGKPQVKALRNMPKFEVGFRESSNAKTNKFDVGNRLYQVASFFSGCGGLDIGFKGGFTVLNKEYKTLPFNIIKAYDFLQDAVDCYKLNIDDCIEHADLTQVDIESVPKADILIGGFPCQDFSSSGPKTGFDGKRGKLYQILLNYMKIHKPRIVVGENVIHLARMKNGEVMKTMVQDFESVGYHFDVWNLYAPDYGVPQSRKRLIFVGVRNDIEGFPVKPNPTNLNSHVTISQALKDLEEITDETVTNQSQYFVASKATSGGGQGDTVNHPDKVALCIRANSRGRIQFHYKLPRRLTVRECARLQTFPDEFVFPYSTQRNLTLIGNAVPPVLAHAVAKSIANFIDAVDNGINVEQSITKNKNYKLNDSSEYYQDELEF